MSSQAKLSTPSRLFLSGFFLTNVGNGMYTLAIGQMLYKLTGSVLGYALVVSSEFIFKLALQGVSRFDEVDPVRICTRSDTCRAIAMGAAAILLWQHQPYLGIALATLAINVFKPFYISATFRFASQINRPSQLERYNAGFLTAKQSGYLLGIGCYGLVLHELAPQWVILLNLASYVAMLTVLLSMRRHIPLAPTPAVRLAGIGAGWRYTFMLMRDRMLTRQAILASHDPLLLYLLSLFVLSASQLRFGRNPSAFAWLEGSLVIGAALSAVLVRLKGWQDAARTQWLRLAAAEAVLLAALFAVRNLALACTVLMALGAVSSTGASCHLAGLMRQAAGHSRGRIASFQLLIMSTAMLVSLPLFSWWLDTSLSTSLLYPLALVAVFLLLLLRARSGAVSRHAVQSSSPAGCRPQTGSRL